MRRFKQLIYGIFYLAVFGAIFYGIYSLWLNVPVNRTAVQPSPNAIEVSGEPMIFHPTLSSVSVMAQVQNTNADFAVKSFPYKFVFYDAGGAVLHEVNGDSFIHASEIKYVAEFNLPFADSAKIVSVDFSTGEPNWVPRYSFTQPNLSIQNYNTSSSARGIEVAGSFINNGTVSASRVNIFAVFYSNLGRPAGISGTEVDDVAPGQQKTFLISHPLLNNINLSGTQIYLYGD